MTSKILILLLSVLSLTCMAQIDTTLDYKERFFHNEKIIAPNYLKGEFKHGYWLENFDKNWMESTFKKRKFYRLIEYDNGTPIGKVYDFFNSGELQSVAEYKSLDPEIRTGTFIWFTKKGTKTSLKHYTKDSLIEHSYYENGNLMYQKIYLKGRDMFSYSNSYWYFKNGNPKWFNYSDSKTDTSYYVAGRKNGSIDFQDIYANGNFERTRENRKGELIERRTQKVNSNTMLIEKFKNGLEVDSELESSDKDTNKYIGEYDKVIFYQGQVGGNSAVIIIENGINTEYNVNGQEMSELEYNDYELKYAEHIKKRQNVHYYQEYTKDSILVYEGLFKNVDLPCGSYKVYYSNGQLKIRGYYDKKGRKSGVWYYYNKEGELIYSEYYKKGIENEG